MDRSCGHPDGGVGGVGVVLEGVSDAEGSSERLAKVGVAWTKKEG